MNVRFLLVLFILIIVPAFADDKFITPPPLPSASDVELSLELFDSLSDQKITNVHARVSIINENNEKFDTMKYVEDFLELRIPPGMYHFDIFVDDISTEGKDYIYSSDFRFSASRAERIFLIPAGSLRGTVYRKDTAIPGADVIIYCSTTPKHITTDFSGSFSQDWLTAGSCRVSASSDDLRGEVSAVIRKGELVDSIIMIDEPLSYKKKNSYLLFIPIALFVAFLFLFFLFKTLSKAKNTSQSENPRQEDILKTLNDRERNIVNFLLTNNNKSTQATIKNELGIPKTTLIRIFNSLQAKNIIHIEKVGKMKKITITNWFLNK